MVRLQVPSVFLFGVGAAVAWYVAYKDIRLSTQLMLGLEATSMIIILVLGGVVLAHKGTVIDTAQFSLQGMNFSGFKAALILTIFCFVGYESATTLGEEARNPLKTIPRAVIWSAVISGLFFVVTSYIAVLGFRGMNISLAETKAPFNDLAHDAGVGFFAVILSVGAVISAFACALACINAGARILFSMGRHGVLHERIGSAHAQNATPHAAAAVSSILVFLVPVIMVSRGRGIMEVFDDLGTIATYGFMVVYALVSIAAPVYLQRIGKLTLGSVLLSIVSVLFLIPPIVGTVYPAPDPPAAYYPYYFLGYLAVGIIWFIYLSFRSQHVLERIKADLEHATIELEGDPETPPGA
jgi:amino acid transporter